MVNELDIILIFIVLLGVAIGLRRGLIRVLIGILGIYVTIVVVGYSYRAIGDTLSGGLGELGIRLSSVATRNIAYVVLIILMTVVVELSSRSSFKDTRIHSLVALDSLLGGLIGIFYGALWASLFLVPSQYSVALVGGVWSGALRGSTLVPILNRTFNVAVLDVVRILFINGVPPLYRNSVSARVAALFSSLV
jgi:uncharacterized membrane protein required for colicin V production